MSINELKKRPLFSLTAEEFFELQRHETSKIAPKSVMPQSILTIEEAALFTGYKKSTIYQKTCSETIPFHKKEGSNKIYFRRDELEEWMIGSSRIQTVEEFIEESDAKLLSRKR